MREKCCFMRKVLAVGLVAGCVSFSAQAELGLQSLADQGLSELGNAVKAEVEAVCKSGSDPAEIKAQLIAILDEAAATGDGGIVRYTIVSVILGCGSDYFDLGQSAIAASAVSKDFPRVTSATVSTCNRMFPAAAQERERDQGGESGDTDGESGGESADDEQGGESGGGESEEWEQQSGGGTLPNPFDDPDIDIDDGDIEATDT